MQTMFPATKTRISAAWRPREEEEDEEEQQNMKCLFRQSFN